jgi:hypothetical protein
MPKISAIFWLLGYTANYHGYQFLKKFQTYITKFFVLGPYLVKITWFKKKILLFDNALVVSVSAALFYAYQSYSS